MTPPYVTLGHCTVEGLVKANCTHYLMGLLTLLKLGYIQGGFFTGPPPQKIKDTRLTQDSGANSLSPVHYVFIGYIPNQ